MDTESQKRFDDLMKKEPAALMPADVEFLCARRSYLSAEQLDKFADILPSKSVPLTELSDKDLRKLAKSLDIVPGDFESREDLIKEIQAKQSPQ